MMLGFDRRQRANSQRGIGLLATLVIVTISVGGCTDDPVERRAKDCERVQAAVTKLQTDLQAGIGGNTLPDLQKLKETIRRSADDLHKAAAETKDEQLKKAVEDVATNIEQTGPDSNPMASMMKINELGKTLVTQCTRAPGA